MSEMPTTTSTYVGRRNDTKGAIVYAYIHEGETAVSLYKKPLLPGAAVGSIITLTFADEARQQYWTGGALRPKVTGVADVAEEVLLRWQASDVAAYQAKAQADVMTRTIRETNHLDHHIDALAGAARGMTGTQRAAFARWVAERIR